MHVPSFTQTLVWLSWKGISQLDKLRVCSKYVASHFMGVQEEPANKR